MHHTNDPPKVTQNEALAYLIPTMYCMWHSVSIRVIAEVRVHDSGCFGVNTTFTSYYVQLGQK